jgi:hypothetical protein
VAKGSRNRVWHTFWARTFAAATLVLSGAVNAALVSAGIPTTSVPSYLTDGSYLFGITVSLGPDQVLLPVEITGTANLQNWQFDVLFDNTVVQEVDPSDGTSGIYGAEFTSGDSNSLSFILGGFPDNSSGLVDGVAGFYPSLINGPSGDGVLAYILFEYLPGQQTNDPGFGIENVTIAQQVPEPSTLALLVATLLIVSFARRASAAAVRQTNSGVR